MLHSTVAKINLFNNSVQLVRMAHCGSGFTRCAFVGHDCASESAAQTVGQNGVMEKLLKT